MKRKNLFAALLSLVLLLTACGGGDAPTQGTDSAHLNGAAMDMEFSITSESKAESAPERPSADMAVGGGGSAVYRNENAKLIRTARLSIQTTEFDAASAQLETIVTSLGGYFENVSYQGGGYRDQNARRNASFTVRVPADQYDAFLSQSGELGYVTHRSEETEDIGELYYDTESRLKTQRTKQERLLALLEKANTMEDIISLENALSDVEYQIERLSSDLNRYDGLVGFATIYLELNEVIKVSQEPGATQSLTSRMGAGFASSLDGLVTGIQDGLIWASYNLFGLLALGAAVAAGVVILRKKFRKRAKPGQNEPVDKQ